jgi:hypothetical protein
MVRRITLLRLRKKQEILLVSQLEKEYPNITRHADECQHLYSLLDAETSSA